MPIAYQFLPWVRRGLGVALDAVDDLSGGLSARGVAHVGVRLAGPAAGTPIAPLPVRLYGPGDVIGIDAGLVVRSDPKPNASNFEPNYLAIVDFDPPDFPWLLTPARANADHRLRPWLVLVVLDLDKTRAPHLQAQAPLPSVRIAAADVASELPDLADSWSWAHAQVVSQAAAGDEAGVRGDLQGRPASNVSRLVSSRRLEPNKHYVACVVPAFEPGRLRGLGLAKAGDPAMDTLAPAWNPAAAADVVLPVYYHWSFSTGPAGDFESLARRLRTPGSYKGTPVEAQLAALGTSPMAVDDLINGNTPGLVATMEGALVPIHYTPGTPPEAVQAESLAIIVNTPAEQVVSPVGDGPLNAEGRRMEVKPPLVGAWHARRHTVTTGALGNDWLADLNLNPRYRGAAGYGAEIVRRNQEDYVDACWDQIGTIRDAEMRFNLTRLAIEAQQALKRKHLDVLPPARLLQLMGPALARLEAIDEGGTAWKLQGRVGSVGGQLDRSSLPPALAGTAMRRALSPQRRMLRQAARLRGALTNQVAAGLSASYVGQMAAASSKPAAFTANDFMPDGILGARLFDGAAVPAADADAVDLRAAGFAGTVSAAQVRGVRSAVDTARTALARNGVPSLSGTLAGEGVFTDEHAERFGALAAGLPNVAMTDWIFVSQQVRQVSLQDPGTAAGGGPGGGVVTGTRPGLDGVLIEAGRDSGLWQFSGLRVDAASGQLRVDQAPLRFDAGRAPIAVGGAVLAPQPLRGIAPAAPAGRRAAATGSPPSGGLSLARTSAPALQTLGGTGLVNALPADTLTTRVHGDAAPLVTLDPRTGRGGVVLTPRPRGAGEVVLDPDLPRLPLDPAMPQVPADMGSVSVPPLYTQREVLGRFAEASRGVRIAWRDPLEASGVALEVVDFGLDQAAAVIRARTAPALTLSARLAGTVSIAAQAATGASLYTGRFLRADALAAEQRYMIPALFDRVMAWPHLNEALYRALSASDPEAFMPGVGNLPQDLIMLVQVNPCFIDAFMAGANFEMNRELLWRGFPTDLRGTPFQRFWDRVGLQGGQIVPLPDMEPMHRWREQPLGGRGDENLPDPDRVALLVRGQLLRRYPNTAVYAWPRDPKAGPGAVQQLLKGDDGRPPPGTVQVPVFSGVIDPDITFFGFDIDHKTVGDWCFVLEERMGEPRFGFDVPDPPRASPAAGPVMGPKRRSVLSDEFARISSLAPALLAAERSKAYKSLDWGHVGVAPGAHWRVTENLVDITGRTFDGFPALPDTPTAAEVASALMQRPFRAYFVGNDLAT